MFSVGTYVICNDIVGVVLAPAENNEIKLLCSDGVERVIRVNDPSSIGEIISPYALAHLFYRKALGRLQK